MTRNRQIRMAAPALYSAAILLTVFIGSGKAVAAVCCVGAVLVGLVYRLTAEDCDERPDRAARRQARAQRRYH